MKRTLYGLILLAVALLAISAVATTPAAAQVPPGVVVDSIVSAVDWTVVFPERAHHLLADPKTGRMSFITGMAATGGNPVWMSSTDFGATWSTLTGFLTGAARVAVYNDADFTNYITYRRSLATGPIAIQFQKDPNGDGTGLTPAVMVNDTNVARTPNYPDIVVSPDGKHIIIAAIRWNQMDTVFAFVSHDSGATWTTKTIVSAYDPANAPIAGSPGLQWYTPALAMGKNGYAIFMIAADYDSTSALGEWQLYTETHDYGSTWSKPAWVTPAPSGFQTTETWWPQGQVVVTNDSIPHFAAALMPTGASWEGGPRQMFEVHKQGGTWVYHQISHLDQLTGSYDHAKQGVMTVDTLGRLYCVYADRNKSALPSWNNGQFSNQLFISGSSDGGNTWTEPVRLTDKERQAAGVDGDVKSISLPQVPPVMPSHAVALWLNGVYPGLYTGGTTVTAWAQAQFPLNVVWTGPYDKDTKAPKANGYAIASKGASAFKWKEISGTGTKVSGWHNGAPAFGDSARDDGSAGPFPIGFNFWYYGKSYSTFSVGANGLLGLSDSILNTAVNQPAGTKGFYDGSYNFPGAGNPFHAVVAAYYNDLDMTPHALYGTGHGDVYYWTNSAKDTAVIEWYQAGDFNSETDTTLTFEVILAKADSSVGIMIKDIGNTGTELTAKVGIQAADSVGVAYWEAGYPAGNTPANNTGVIFKHSGPTSVNPGSQTPLAFGLMQNYPNPFNPTTRISYSLPRQMKATLKIFNILGQEVATLVNDVQSAGEHTVNFTGSGLASGVYIYRLQAGEFTSSYKMVLMK